MIQAEEKLHEVEMSHAKLEKQNSEYKKKINRQQRGIVKLQRMYQEKDNELQKHGLTPSLLLQVNRLYEKLQLAHIQSDAWNSNLSLLGAELTSLERGKFGNYPELFIKM